MPGGAVTLEIKSTKAKGRVYTYRVLRWTDPETGKRRSETLGRADDRRHPSYITLREAKTRRSLKAAEFDQSPRRRSRGLTLGEIFDWYIKKRKDEGVSARSLEVDDYAGRLLFAYFPREDLLKEIPRASAEEGVRSARDFWQKLNSGELSAKISQVKWKTARWSEASARKYLRSVRAMFNDAIDDEIIESHPFLRLASTTTPVDETWRFVNRKETRLLIQAALDHGKTGWAKAIALARFGAHSRGDILANTWDNVDFGINEMRFRRAKNGAKQHVPIDDDLLEFLVRWREERASIKIADDTIIHPGELVLDNPGRDMALICRWAGVEPYGKPIHALRKSCITEWVSANHPPHAVQVWAGHKLIKTTLEFYTRVSEKDMAAAKASSDASPLFQLAGP